MTRRTKTIIFSILIPCLLGAALLSTAIWGVSQRSRAQDYQNATEAVYCRAFSDLVTELNTIEVTLSKLQIAGTRMQCITLLDSVWLSAGTCVGLMSQIPASHVDTYEMNQFIVRVGDYAHSISTELLRGSAMSSKDTEQLSFLREACNRLAADLSARYDGNKYSTELIDAEGYYTTAADEYKTDATRMQYPTLLYDGPFAESTEKTQAKGLNGGQCDQGIALQCAQKFAPTGSTLEFATESNGAIPSYDFVGTSPDGRHIDASISKQGAKLVWFLCECTCDDTNMGDPDVAEQQKLTQTALMFLKDHQYYNVKATYMQYYDGFVLINFVDTQDDVMIYNDLIKVWVERGTCQVIGADARDYLFSHVKRDLPKVKLSEDDARRYVSENLKITMSRLALIPITPQKEALCYEFTGTFNNEQYIVYVNAENGYEEQIFKIINSQDGSTVM